MKQQTKKTDAQIQSEVLEELKWDTRVKATDVGVEVDAGIVALTGTVNSWTSRLAAQEAAHRVLGVLDVANDIQVKLPTSSLRDDTDIARAVRNTLEWDTLVPHERITSTVSDGVVMLEGEVDYWSQFDDAERSVRNLEGVREVRNLISVQPSLSGAAAKVVRGAIEQALERHAQHAAKHVQISIVDGKVTLSGEVPSWAERNAVEGAVRGTPGVRKIQNQLLIRA
jgi:osmotically-inducible protein OsmY